MSSALRTAIAGASIFNDVDRQQQAFYTYFSLQVSGLQEFNTSSEQQKEDSESRNGIAGHERIDEYSNSTWNSIFVSFPFPFTTHVLPYMYLSTVINNCG